MDLLKGTEKSSGPGLIKAMCPSMLMCAEHRRRVVSFCKLRRILTHVTGAWTLFPSVSAQESLPSEGASIEEYPKSMERHSRVRPQYFVSDSDVQEYLAAETGMDRLRQLFQKS